MGTNCPLASHTTPSLPDKGFSKGPKQHLVIPGFSSSRRISLRRASHNSVCSILSVPLFLGQDRWGDPVRHLRLQLRRLRGWEIKNQEASAKARASLPLNFTFGRIRLRDPADFSVVPAGVAPPLGEICTLPPPISGFF